MKRVISFAVACIMVGLLAACSAAETKTDVSDVSGSADSITSAADETTTAADEQNARENISDELPEMDFEGREFRISTADTYAYEMYSDELNGDVCNDAVYKRNSAIEERFNVDIKTIVTASADETAQPRYVEKTILAGEDAFDISAIFTYLTGNAILSHLYHNWNDVPYVDFEKPWWIQSAQKAFSVGDKMYVAVGDLCITAMLLSYGVFYNMNQAANYNIPDLYQTVYDGKWTIDYLKSITKDVYSDLNGDNTPDEDDFYGFTADRGTNLDVYLAAFDIPLISKDDNNYPVLDIDEQKFTTALEQVYDLYYNAKGSNIQDYGKEIISFSKGKAMFITTWMNNAFTAFRDMVDNYGILPYPKFDEAQSKYYTNSMDNYSMLGIPMTVTDLEFIGIITEALNAESYKTVMPAYYDVALQTKYTRDDNSVAMLDIIMQGRNYDFSIIHGTYLCEFPYLFRNMISKKSTDFSSQYAKVKEKIIEGLNTITAKYLED